MTLRVGRMASNGSNTRSSQTAVSPIKYKENSSPFQYSPLPENSVRLLTVLGPGSDGTIECTLTTEQLTESLQFYALSYAWGSGLKNRHVRCNGLDLAVTESVHDALTALFPTLAADQVSIWIDAVSVDQLNQCEKEREVQRMDDIYSSAKTVLVWLGPEAQDSAMAMRIVPLLATRLSVIESSPLMWSDLELHGLPHYSHPVWPAIGHVYRRAWFGRLWTLQESVLAKAIRVFCGKEEADWRCFSQVASDLTGRLLTSLVVGDQYLPETEDGFRTVGSISWAKSFHQTALESPSMIRGETDLHSTTDSVTSRQAVQIPLSSLLNVSQHKLSSDPRDRVYGMLSLTSKEFRNKIEVSYSKSLRQLYLDTGKACLEQDKSLGYLNLVAGRRSPLDLPTWCFDLGIPNEEIAPFEYYLRSGVRMERGDVPEAAIRTFTDQEYIETVGFRADIIDQIVPSGGSFRRGTMVDRVTKSHAWQQKCLQLAQVIGDKHPGIDMEMAYAYTLTANTIARAPVGELLKLAFEDAVRDRVSFLYGATDKERYRPPKERMSLFTDTKEQMAATCPGRSFFTTVRGRLGVGPPDVLPGDIVIVLYGAGPVFVLRERTDVSAFEFVGDAFVHGLMELDRTPEDVIGPTETFRII